jgi:hypothetical protein
MDISHFEKKGPLMNMLERFPVYMYISKGNLHMNDIHRHKTPSLT